MKLHVAVSLFIADLFRYNALQNSLNNKGAKFEAIFIL